MFRVDPRNPFFRRSNPQGRWLGLGLATVLVAGPVGSASAAAVSLAECAAIGGDQARLACYDRLSGHQPVAAARADSVASEAMEAPVAASAAPPQGQYGGQYGTQNGGQAGGPTVAASEPSLLDRAWGFDPDSERYKIALYQPNYLLFANYTDNINAAPFQKVFTALSGEEEDLDSVEARFQISFKFRMWASEDHRWGIWAAYTQTSMWQVYNDDISSPFRDTNYMPELMLSFRPGLSFAGFDWNLLNVGYAHQSNGRSDPISRSWDRLIASIGIERGNFALVLRPWVRIDDEDSDDDNPDITDYMGYGDITAYYKWRGHSFSLMGRGNPDTGKGTAELTWMTPKLVGPVRLYVRGTSGYGDTMIDYNWRQNTVGIGVALNDAL
ncbi:phospholipase A [Thiohalocapsa marina]|uniref:Phospholipase A1 n=2 Tax=Thiohalocapsa marina TaxID=424902 RepID=A0A5M8FQD1_9GAMM|nr:phospholipase A [Thiohalocapsa marina]